MPPSPVCWRSRVELDFEFDRFHVTHPDRATMLVGEYTRRSPDANRVANIVFFHAVHNCVSDTSLVIFSNANYTILQGLPKVT